MDSSYNAFQNIAIDEIDNINDTRYFFFFTIIQWVKLARYYL